MTELNQLCCPALIFLICVVLILCACVMAGWAADNAEEIWRSMQEDKQR